MEKQKVFICKIRKCNYRKEISNKEIIKNNINPSCKSRTCIFSNTSNCLGNKLYLE